MISSRAQALCPRLTDSSTPLCTVMASPWRGMRSGISHVTIHAKNHLVIRVFDASSVSPIEKRVISRGPGSNRLRAAATAAILSWGNKETTSQGNGHLEGGYRICGEA